MYESFIVWGSDKGTQNDEEKKPYSKKSMELFFDLGNDKTKKLYFINDCIITLNSKGEVFQKGKLGTNELKGKKIEFNKLKVKKEPVIKKIAIGDNHALFLSDENEVFSEGDNTYGQLGLGKENTCDLGKIFFNTEQNVSDKIIDIYAYKNTSFAISKDYKLYIWGDKSFSPNEASKEDIFIPIHICPDIKVAKIKVVSDRVIIHGVKENNSKLKLKQIFRKKLLNILNNKDNKLPVNKFWKNYAKECENDFYDIKLMLSRENDNMKKIKSFKLSLKNPKLLSEIQEQNFNDIKDKLHSRLITAVKNEEKKNNNKDIKILSLNTNVYNILLSLLTYTLAYSKIKDLITALGIPKFGFGTQKMNNLHIALEENFKNEPNSIEKNKMIITNMIDEFKETANNELFPQFDNDNLLEFSKLLKNFSGQLILPKDDFSAEPERYLINTIIQTAMLRKELWEELSIVLKRENDLREKIWKFKKQLKYMEHIYSIQNYLKKIKFYFKEDTPTQKENKQVSQMESNKNSMNKIDGAINRLFVIKRNLLEQKEEMQNCKMMKMVLMYLSSVLQCAFIKKLIWKIMDERENP